MVQESITCKIYQRDSKPTESFAYLLSVKKRIPLVGCTLTSLSELNWRPKKLSKMTVALNGGVGCTRTTVGAILPRPDATSISSPL